jgi:hypothetical protein
MNFQVALTSIMSLVTSPLRIRRFMQTSPIRSLLTNTNMRTITPYSTLILMDIRVSENTHDGLGAKSNQQPPALNKPQKKLSTERFKLLQKTTASLI